MALAKRPHTSGADGEVSTGVVTTAVGGDVGGVVVGLVFIGVGATPVEDVLEAVLSKGLKLDAAKMVSVTNRVPWGSWNSATPVLRGVGRLFLAPCTSSMPKSFSN